MEDLLASRSGIYIPSGAETQWMKENQPTHGAAVPGEQFFYNNWDFNALGVVFAAETNLTIGEALDCWLAVPLGMEDFHPSNVTYDALRAVLRYPYYRSSTGLF